MNTLHSRLAGSRTEFSSSLDYTLSLCIWLFCRLPCYLYDLNIALFYLDSFVGNSTLHCPLR